ncbi:MAG: FlgB family protein [Albidovulum sp.]
MFTKPEVLTLASSLAAHAASRQSAITQNVANADTPGYRAKDVADFATTYQAQDGNGLRQTRSGHIGSTPSQTRFAASDRIELGTLSPNGNSVSLETEMVKAAEVRHDHDMALAVYSKSLGILRASLGRR